MNGNIEGYNGNNKEIINEKKYWDEFVKVDDLSQGWMERFDMYKSNRLNENDLASKLISNFILKTRSLAKKLQPIMRYFQ